MIDGVPYDAEVEYLYCADGNQYINIGLFADSDMKFEMGFMNSTSSAMAFGSLDSSSRFGCPANPIDWFYFGGTNNVKTATPELTLSVFHSVEMSKSGIFIDGTLVSSSLYIILLTIACTVAM